MRWLLPLLALVSCSQYEIVPERPSGEVLVPVALVDPHLLRFPAQEPGRTVSALFELSNAGDDTLRVDDLRVDGSSSYSLVGPQAPLDLLPGESTWARVQFEPVNLENDGRIIVVSNDPETPELPVHLTGQGLLPRLVVAPPHHDFGTVGIGCEESLTFTLVNAGTADLELTQGLHAGASFTTQMPELPATIRPGHAKAVGVSFLPVEEAAYEGRLWFSSNDPAGDDTAWLYGQGVPPGHLVQRFTQPEPSERTDIFLYVDRSTSMDDDAVNLTANFEQLVATLEELEADWQLAVATYDDGCHNGPIIHADTEDAWLEFYEAVHGPKGAKTEAGLTIAANGLHEASSPLGCNWGLLRANAQTSIILVSDEPEQSLGPWTLPLGRILAIRPDAVISAVAGPLPDGCETAWPGSGYWEAAKATGGTFLSICDTDWGSGLETLANISVGLRSVFQLDHEPWPETLEVYLDGGRLLDGWRWDPELNAIVLDDPPDPGSVVEVHYHWSGEC